MNTSRQFAPKHVATTKSNEQSARAAGSEGEQQLYTDFIRELERDYGEIYTELAIIAMNYETGPQHGEFVRYGRATYPLR